MSDVSAKAGQMVTMTYPFDAPNRMMTAGNYKYVREVTLTTEEAVDLCEQLRHALYD